MHAFAILTALSVAFLPMVRTKAAETPKLSPDLPYQARKTDPVTYDVDFSVVITPPYHAKLLKVWLPVPQNDAGQEVEEGEITTFPLKVTSTIGQERVFGNKFAYFEFDHPEGAQIIRHQFKIKVWELHWDIDSQKVLAVQHWPESFEPYLRTERQAVVISDNVKQLAQEIAKGNQDAGRNLTAVMDWVAANVKYDHIQASLQASSEYALKNRKGHCSDYHGLCASLGRALGYPTRVTYGINAYPKNSPSHCKLEAFLPPYGWVSFDVSVTQQLIAAIKKDQSFEDGKKEQLIQAATKRLQRGFRDNTWFLQTRGTDYELAPPARRKVAVVRTIYAEADGVALPDPDPANPEKHEFAWMTVHKFTPDRLVINPFKSWKSLETNTPK
jgi:transglutaminase-like putative cysteine protease